MTNVKNARQPSREDLWPASGLETLGYCPVCNDPGRSLLYEELDDAVFFSAPGRWSMWQCAGCRSAYLDPRPNAATIGDAYSNYYTHSLVESEAEKKSFKDTIKVLIRNSARNALFGTRFAPAFPASIYAGLIPISYRVHLATHFRYLPRMKKGSTVLDVGCGNAWWLSAARAGGWHVTGMDPDPSARSSAPTGIDVVSSMKELTDRDGRFDHITLNHVIEHVHDPAEMLGTCLSLLKPGGTIYIETPNIDAPTHKRFGSAWRGLEVPRHLAIFSKTALEQLLERSGFRNIELKPRKSPAPSMTVQSERIKGGADPYDGELPDDLPIDSTDKPEFLSYVARR